MADQPSPEELAEMEERIKNMSPEELKEFQKSQCIFCQIIAGKIPAKKVYEDENTIAVLDINPANLGHILVLPKEHYMIMPQIPDSEIGAVFNTVKLLSQACLKSLSVDGTNILVANGAVAGQKAQHFMVHIIPRSEGDNLNFTIPQKTHKDEELDAIRAKMASLIRGKSAPKKEAIEQKPIKPASIEKPAQIIEEKTSSNPIQKPSRKKSDDINIDDIAELFKN